MDVDGDGQIDDLLLWSTSDSADPKGTINVFLHEDTVPEVVTGSSDIEQQLDIAPGTSVVYVVQGKVRSNAGQIASTVVANPAQRGEDLRDNVVPRSSGVLLQVAVEEPDAVPGEALEFEVRVTNAGPQNAKNVHVRETISAALQDVTWSRTDQVFPGVIQLEQLQGADGAKFIGPRRTSDRGVVSRDYGGPEFVSLGSRVGIARDVDGIR